jgi:lipoprotein-anchoring transpeptidase ErfK/SrfK
MVRPLAVICSILLFLPSARAVTVDVPTTHKVTTRTVTTRTKTVTVPARRAVAAAPTPVPVIPDAFPNRVIISVHDQKLVLLQNGAKVASYPVSTSKFGLGDAQGRMTTPLGYLAVAQKIGDHAPVGAVFHNRRFTGEILAPNAPGRDPIITRIIWLRGLESQNAHAFDRCIYIHGTPEEKFIGRPASYGCIRMKSSDVALLYNQLPLGALVQIVPDKMPNVPKPGKNAARAMNPPAPAAVAAPTKSASVPVLVASRGHGA